MILPRSTSFEQGRTSIHFCMTMDSELDGARHAVDYSRAVGDRPGGHWATSECAQVVACAVAERQPSRFLAGWVPDESIKGSRGCLGSPSFVWLRGPEIVKPNTFQPCNPLKSRSNRPVKAYSDHEVPTD